MVELSSICSLLLQIRAFKNVFKNLSLAYCLSINFVILIVSGILVYECLVIKTSQRNKSQFQYNPKTYGNNASERTVLNFAFSLNKKILFNTLS